MIVSGPFTIGPILLAHREIARRRAAPTPAAATPRSSRSISASARVVVAGLAVALLTVVVRPDGIGDRSAAVHAHAVVRRKEHVVLGVGRSSGHGRGRSRWRSPRSRPPRSNRRARGEHRARTHCVQRPTIVDDLDRDAAQARGARRRRLDRGRNGRTRWRSGTAAAPRWSPTGSPGHSPRQPKSGLSSP